MNDKKLRDIWVFSEHQNGKLMNVTLELLGEGRRLAEEVGEECRVCAVLIGHKTEYLIEELHHFGADIVYSIDREFLEYYNEDGYAKVIGDAVNTFEPGIILFGATRIGNDLASRLASRLDTGLATNCMRLDINTENYIDYLKNTAAIDIEKIDIGRAEGLLKMTRPGSDGLMDTMICTGAEPQLATVNPGVMDKMEKDESRKGVAIHIESDISEDDIKVKLIESVKKVSTMASLTDAQIVCAGGRGLGDAEGLKLIEEFAARTGGAMGVSRFVVDSGWTDLSHQVGQSGTVVKPKIYFACGISGAIQHIVGMQNSDIIVAINKNPDAPIMEIADFAICGDLFKIVPEIIEIWDNYK